MMNKINKLFLLFTPVLSIGILSNLNVDNANKASAEELSIVSGGDAFALLDKSYASDESFVYTADLNFRNGQAGGLAFGSEENQHYYVLNMDRVENRVKLLYFSSNEVGGYNAKELLNDYFIGNDKITEHELAMVKPKVAGIERVNLKVVLTCEDSHVYTEFFIEGIKRFGVDSVIDLNTFDTPKYQGGRIGMNCFNGDVYLNNIEYGKSDYSYFSEPYRNQYHLQPFAKWTNDPNALCYYNGYYHVYYQTNPFGLLWGDMYWGHARSRDLIHFEFLPICLFPETEAMGFGPGNAFMWSGCAITYTKGMSIDIDKENWFPNGGGNGMLAIYTRDGGLQDQVVISSDDEGLTWTKRHRIPQTITGYTSKIDWRDPKIFPAVKDTDGRVLLWGMTLSSYGLNKGWFLKSSNLLDWSIAGQFALPTPECIGVGFIKDENNVEHAYLTNKSRSYILGNLTYNPSTANFDFIDENGVNISTYSLEDMPLKPLDFGPDTYASQSFYISDPASEFYGKDIVLNWFSGDLNAPFCTGPGEYANLRGRWNGGFTMPVEYGVANTSEGLRITQKPISVGNSNLAKTEIVNITNEELKEDSINPLKDVHTHVFELSASIKTNNNSSITFKVDIGDDEYMQFGWNEIDGYYVDRTYLDDKGINTNVDWHKKYASHILGDSDVKTFYVLSDNGGLEVFCEDFSIPFYFVTTASMYSTGASLQAEDAVINSLQLNEVASTYRKVTSSDEGVLYVSNHDVELDTNFAKSKFVTCWFSGNKDLTWETLSNEDVVEVNTSNQGINVTALKAGTASFKVSVGEKSETINVTVHDSHFESEFTFSAENIVSGNWMMAENEIIGEKSSGNAFLLANESGSDFTFSGEFDIASGTAGALVFRAKADMSAYLVANYDSNERVVKLWSTHGELARSGEIDVGKENIFLSIKAIGKNVSITINGNIAINYVLKDDEPLEGKFGLNVFSGKAIFRSLSLTKENYEYISGNLEIALTPDQFIYEVYDLTAGNIRLEPGFYYQESGKLYIRESYFALIENGIHEFKIVGASYTFVIKVNVNASSSALHVDDIFTEVGLDVSVYIGNHEINSIKVNDEEIGEDKYIIKDYKLVISSSCFEEGDNEVLINNEVSFVVNVANNDDVIIHGEIKIDLTPVIIAIIAGGVLVVAAGVLIPVLILKKKKGAK